MTRGSSPRSRSSMDRKVRVRGVIGTVSRSVAVAAVVALVCTTGASAASASLLAAAPPMGWDSWYGNGCAVDQGLVERTALRMLSSGMVAAGYRYVNIDDCWMAPTRDRHGRLRADPRKFPAGIAALAAFLHARGLKLGMYLDGGPRTCSGFPGSAGHIAADVRSLAAWGADYVKVDYCRVRPAPPRPLYTSVRRALDATGRPIVLSICDWGFDAPWEWARGVGQLWRTAGDYFSYGAPRNWWGAVMRSASIDATVGAFAAPGAFNDPDALLAGTGFLSPFEQRAQLSLWSILAAPLLASGRLDRAPAATLADLANPEIVAVDQDSAGVQGRLVSVHGGVQTWLRPLADGSTALLVLDAGAAPRRESVNLGALGLGPGPYRIRDLWAHRSVATAGSLTFPLAAHSSVLLRVHG